jgi:hypothetical protein
VCALGRLKGGFVAGSNSNPDRGSFLADNWAKLYFGIAIALLVFGYGVAVGIYHLFPYQQIRNGISAASDWTENAEHYARIKPDKHLRASRGPGSEVNRYDQNKAWDGITLLSGMWGETLGVKLVDMKGDLLHEWMVSFNEIWPDAPHLELQPHDWDTNIHGLIAYPNGDIVFNFEHDGLVRIDRCAVVRWRLPELAHHFVVQAPDGNLWVGGVVHHKEKDPRFNRINAPFAEDFMLEVSPGGEVLRRISVLDLFYNSGLEGLLLASTQATNGIWKGTVQSRGPDITHLNDMDILTESDGAAFELFDAGDMLISLRNLHMIMVIDPDTETIKWYKLGPWLMQHDPDFLPDGKIMVFDNRARSVIDGKVYGSRILELEPNSRAVEILYDGSDEDPFFTSQMGKSQPLPNGNVLIAEPDGGRAIEVNRDGTIVWEYINRWSEEQVAVITEATRLPKDFFHMSQEACN